MNTFLQYDGADPAKREHNAGLTRCYNDNAAAEHDQNQDENCDDRDNFTDRYVSGFISEHIHSLFPSKLCIQ